MAEFLIMEMETYMAGIAQSFKQAREKNGMSLNALAEQCGVSRQSISKIEKGISNAGIFTLELVSQKGLGIPLWKIIKEAERKLQDRNS